MNDLTVAEPIAVDTIRSRILTIRGVQVMLSSDLAYLYEVEVKHLHRQVKRNADRFPSDFVIHLSPEEVKGLRCQNVTSKRGGDRYGLLAFTEQGIAMLSSVLKSDRAAEVNVSIMRTFVAMRRALASLAPLLSRIETAERRQITDQARNEERFDTIFKAMDGGDFPPQKVFYEGRHYEAYSFAKKLVRRATKSIVLVDGYCDDVTLDILLHKRGIPAARRRSRPMGKRPARSYARASASVTIATVAKTPITATAIAKFNKQNPTLTVKTTGVFHDRFLIIDGAELYHFGASLKNLGRQYCAISKMDAAFIPSIMERI